MFAMSVVSVLVACSACVLLSWLFSRSRNLPPGPWSFPVIGYRFGSGLIHECFADLARSYGSVFSIRRGPYLMVVLNDADAIRQAMVKNADAFSDHFVPGPMKWSLPKSNKNASIACANGKAWSELMRFCLPALRSFGFGKKSLAPSINLEAQYMSEEIAKLKGALFSPVHNLNMATANIICQLVFGQRFDYDDAEFQRILRSMSDMVNVSESDPVIVFPFLMNTPWYRGHRQTYADLENFILSQLRLHRDTFQNNNIRDFIDAYMADDISQVFTLEEFWRVVLDLFAGGTETTAAFLSWALLYMAVHPKIQRKAQSELDSVVGRGRQPTLDDRPNLPFCEAVVLEIMRIRPILPVALPHVTSADVSIRGHAIPKGTLIIPNVWGAHHDPKAWNDPDIFDPERFLEENGDIKKNSAWIVFGAGRRECPGAQLAKMEAFLFFTNLIQKFEFKLPADQSEVSLQGRNGLTLWPQPYKVCAVER